jgi:hypothetical protein
MRHGSSPRRLALCVITASVAAVLTSSGCWNPVNPATGDPDTPEYYTNVDSAWKVVKNLEYAYQARDLDHYMDCFRDDFEFHLLEVDWDDYDGDGVIDEYWGLDLEEQFHEAMFGFVDEIDLTLTGISEWPWSGDSTGQSLELDRTFDLKVYYTIPGSPYEGSQASGQAMFICRPDSSGQWYIWQWFDLSET